MAVAALLYGAGNPTRDTYGCLSALNVAVPPGDVHRFWETVREVSRWAAKPRR